MILAQGRGKREPDVVVLDDDVVVGVWGGATINEAQQPDLPVWDTVAEHSRAVARRLQRRIALWLQYCKGEKCSEGLLE